MKKSVATALLFAIPFGLLIGLAYSLDAPVSASILVGIATAIAAALGVGGYVAWRRNRFNAWTAKICAPYEPEGIVHHGYAVAGVGGNAMALAGLATVGMSAALLDSGGVLVLTAQRLLFVPHRHNLLGKRVEIPVSEIAAVGPGYGFVGNTIRVGMRSRQSLHFKVENRSAWLAKLPGARLPAPGAATRPAP